MGGDSVTQRSWRVHRLPMHWSNHIRNDYNGIWPKPCQNDDQGGQCCFPVHIPILCSRLCYHGYVQFQRCFLRSSSRFLDFQRKSLKKSAARLMNNWLLSITNHVIENRFDRRKLPSPCSEPKLYFSLNKLRRTIYGNICRSFFFQWFIFSLGSLRPSL